MRRSAATRIQLFHLNGRYRGRTVTRPRITQILNLLQLAPDIQEALLFLPRVTRGRTRITESALRSVAAQPLWDEQRRMVSALLPSAPNSRRPE